LRSWVKEQTFLDLGYVEQLYTFGDRGRHLVKPEDGPRVVSVGYLALTRATGELKAPMGGLAGGPAGDHRHRRRAGPQDIRLQRRFNRGIRPAQDARSRRVRPGTFDMG
jgi:hypothetical protein